MSNQKKITTIAFIAFFMYNVKLFQTILIAYLGLFSLFAFLFIVKINLAMINNSDLEINLDYSEYNEYYLENRKILNLLYIYPKIMAYYSIYYYFKGENKFKRLILNFIYYKCSMISQLLIKLSVLLADFSEENFKKINLKGKKRRAWLFIVLYESPNSFKYAINMNLCGMLMDLRGRKIILKNKNIILNDELTRILKKVYMFSIMGAKGFSLETTTTIVKGHPHASYSTENQGEKGKFIISSIFTTSNNIWTSDGTRIATSKENHLHKQNKIISRVVAEATAPKKFEPFYQKHKINAYFENILKISEKLNQIQLLILAKEQWILHQTHDSIMVKKLQEMKNQNIFSKNTEKAILEDYRLEYEQIEKIINEEFGPKNNSEEVEEVFEKLVKLNNSLNKQQKIALFADIMIEIGAWGGSKDSLVVMMESGEI